MNPGNMSTDLMHTRNLPNRKTILFIMGFLIAILIVMPTAGRPADQMGRSKEALRLEEVARGFLLY
jgi:hypothetical protein